MLRTLITLIVGLSWPLSGQDLRLVHKKQNAFIEIYHGKNNTSIHRVVKTNSCIDTWTKIPNDTVKLFIDSLYRSGWTSGTSSNDVTKDFEIKMVLDSIEKAPTLSDSTNRFYYHIDITEKNGKTSFVKGYDWTTQVQTVVEAIKYQKYSVEILLIKGTSIYELTLGSSDIFDSDRTPGTYKSGPFKALYF